MRLLTPIKWLLIILMLGSLGMFGIAASAPFSGHWLPAVAGVFYPHLMLLIISWAVLWLFLGPRYAILPGIVLIVSVPLSNRIVSVPLQKNANEEDDIEVMSYNVRNFDLYNWSNNMESRNNMMNVFSREQPDVLCLQEFYTEDDGEFPNLDRISNEYNYPYHDFRKTYSARGTDHWGIATFSKHPIVNRGKVDYENSRHHLAVYSDIVIDGDTIRVYNTHLQSNHFGEQDHRFMEKFTVDQDATDVRSFWSIFTKLIRGHQKRKGQVWRLRRSMDKSPHPLILCGDFNDTPISFTYQYLARGFNDPFRIAGTGFGQTFRGPLPLLRIDYILVSTKFAVKDYSILPDDYSDHYPVRCRIAL
ncbi:MAG: hypothetical protein BRD50_06195 [Bacteroidetes bacterium SW_11_45_7]|nr:MAG: hypothetical protein BRD50_06195 [Bacteroidetes bacterium SW_11_45_7]